jgi:hypothetical protein
LFLNYLTKLKNETEKKYNISKNDSCYKSINIVDVSGHQILNISQHDLKYIYDDKNSIIMIQKWLKKDDFDLIPLENGEKIKHSYNYFKALEFYNSEELKKYLDSVRIIEFNKINNLK